MNDTLRKFNRFRNVSLGIGVLGLVFCCLGFIFDRRPFYVSYLFSFLFWTSLSLGCFYSAMIHYLAAGRWGFPARRFLEAGYMTLPLMAVLVVPLFFGLHELYPWARPEAVAADKILQQRSGYENPAAFIIRTAIFFAIWIFIAARLRVWSLQQDSTNDLTPTIKARTLSGPALGIVPLTASFAFVDWGMTVEPDWSSTIFPVIILAGQMLIAIAFIIVLLAWTRNELPFRNFEPKAVHDLGSLLLAFVLFWTYVAFSQVLLIYSANLPHEIGWYLRRIGNDWIWLVGLIALFHFFAPFLLLLFSRIKKNVRLLGFIALVVFVIHAVEIFWVIAPTFYPRIEVHWTDLAAWLGMGGIWLAVFFGNLSRHPLLARNDPRLEQIIAETANAK
jgi:predicted small integral membrane protein